MLRTVSLVLLLSLLVAGALARADETAQELWRFTNGEVERVVDVSGMPDFVRAAVLERLATQGFRRVEAARRATPSRDLEADARTLVRHGGRFPRPEGSPAAAKGLRFLGARGVLEASSERDGLGFRLTGLAPRCPAAAIGLEKGDVLLALDGRDPAPALLRQWDGPPLTGGKLSLRVLRTQGQTETWGLEFVPEPGS